MLLLLLAAGQYAWNAWTLPPLSGYDAGGHAAYILTIVEEERLPEPREGWSTFHPPLYYLLGAAAWSVFEPLGPRALGAGVRAISACAVLISGAVLFALALRRSSAWPSAAVATALLLFVPSVQMAGAMIGNEALGLACASLAVPWILKLQADPRDARAAALAALFAALALATKYTGVFVAAACVVPFLRRDLDARMLRAAAAGAAVAVLVAGPVYVRNVVVSGSPIPMTRDLEPMKSIEAAFVIRDRKFKDYLSFPSGALRHPYLARRVGDSDRYLTNRALTSIWGLAHASTWYDAFGHREPAALRDDDHWRGALLAGLGLVPGALVLFGLGLAAADAIRTRGRATDTPLVLLFGVGLATFIAFTWRAPSVAAGKGSYLLPLAVPAGLFLVRALERLPRRARYPALGLCALAAGIAAVVFTNELLFPPATGFAHGWEQLGRDLPHIADAARRLSPLP